MAKRKPSPWRTDLPTIPFNTNACITIAFVCIIVHLKHHQLVRLQSQTIDITNSRSGLDPTDETSSTYLASDWGSQFFFLAMAGLLAWRPQGLLRRGDA